ncbi:MAG: cobalamin biosynthesis protein CobQ, partial [Candidatus Roizmanbacteria bacterium]|nr:cobalamin biosynthesis protein CobQ [Candidatus Roizmanbacteria bacterium]
RAKARGIETEIVEASVDTPVSELERADLLFMGGAEDWQQEIVSNNLRGEKLTVLKQKIQNGTPGLFICGAYQFLGEYYVTADGKKLACLNILPFYTKQRSRADKRLIGDIIVEVTHPAFAPYRPPNEPYYLIGFENHGGRTVIPHTSDALGKTVVGFGNNDTDPYEGFVYRNTIGTYLHGPLLARNPLIADFLLAKALAVKYNEKIDLAPLNDEIINTNRAYLLTTLYGTKKR